MARRVPPLILLCTIAAVMAAVLWPRPGPAAGSGGPIGHNGRWLTDALGRVLLPHGVNMVAKGSLSPAQEGFGDEDAAWLADNGFDVVRLGLSPDALMPAPGAIDTAYLDSFAASVHNLTDHGLYVLVDIHQDGWGPTTSGNGFPDWMTITHGAENTHTAFPLYYITNPAISAAFESLWNNEAGPGGIGLQDQVGTMWAALASAVGSDPGVLGYDLLNEPWPGLGWQPCLDGPGGCPDLDHNSLDPFYARMATSIRGHDPDHLIFGEPFVLFNFGFAPTNIAPPGNGATGLAFHLYPVTAAAERDVLANALTWSGETHGALIAGEWGATTDPVQITRVADELDQALMPWIFWSYCCEVVKSLSEPPAGANLNAAAVAALVRPHPIAVAGTPTSLTYDTTTRTMTFAYDTAGPGGARFAPGTATVFNVPSRTYADGWRATVAGGTVSSPSDSSTLTVIANPDMQSVTVTISPAQPSPAETTFPAVRATGTPPPLLPPAGSRGTPNGLEGVLLPLALGAFCWALLAVLAWARR